MNLFFKGFRLKALFSPFSAVRELFTSDGKLHFNSPYSIFTQFCDALSEQWGALSTTAGGSLVKSNFWALVGGWSFKFIIAHFHLISLICKYLKYDFFSLSFFFHLKSSLCEVVYGKIAFDLQTSRHLFTFRFPSLGVKISRLIKGEGETRPWLKKEVNFLEWFIITRVMILHAKVRFPSHIALPACLLFVRYLTHKLRN